MAGSLPTAAGSVPKFLSPSFHWPFYLRCLVRPGSAEMREGAFCNGFAGSVPKFLCLRPPRRDPGGRARAGAGWPMLQLVGIYLQRDGASVEDVAPHLRHRGGFLVAGKPPRLGGFPPSHGHAPASPGQGRYQLRASEIEAAGEAPISFTSCLRRAMATASVRFAAPSLASRFSTCSLATVRLMPS